MKTFYKVNALLCVILSLIVYIPMLILDIPYIILRYIRTKLLELGTRNFILGYGIEELLKKVNLNKVEPKKDDTL